MEITLNIHVSGLDNLAAALNGLIGPKADAPISPAEPVSNHGAAPAPTTAPAVPVVPTAAPAITREQICRAGANLLTANPAIMPQLTELLKRYGVQSAQQLGPDQLGGFATELRGMGATI